MKGDGLQVSQDDGWQHEAAYRALAEKMIEEHREGTTELAIVTGNDVLEAHLITVVHRATATTAAASN